MKTVNKSMQLVKAKTVEPEVVESTALTIKTEYPLSFPEGVETLGEKADYLHKYSVESSKRSLGAAILAGWVLSVARSTCMHGQWMEWLKSNVSFSHQTASNYLSLYSQTLGAQRAGMRRPIPLTTEPTEAELELAAREVDGKCMTALYKSTKLIAPTANWGGAGRGQGRKPKDEAAAEQAQLDEIANNPGLLWAAIKEPIDAIWKLHSERDVFNRIGDEELSGVVTMLYQLSDAAVEAMKARAR